VDGADAEVDFPRHLADADALASFKRGGWLPLNLPR